MATLREVFMRITIDPKSAVNGLDAVDKAADETEKSLEDVDRQTLKTSETFKEFGSRAATGAKVAATAFAGAATAVGLFFAKWSDGAMQIDRAAKAYGISTDTLQELSYAAEKLGGEGDAVVEVFKEMSIRITEMAETGSGPALDALTYLKIKAEDLKKLKPEEQFNVIADALANVSDEGAKFFLKDSLFGEEGAIKIGTLLDNGSRGIAEMRKEARELGVVLSGEAIAKGIEFRGTLFTIGKTVEGVANQIAVKMLPFVKQLADKMLAWAQANKDVIASRLESFIEQLVNLTTQLVPLLSDMFGGIVKITDAVGGMDNALAIAAGGWAAWQVAALAAIGPVGAAIAALSAGLAVGAFAGDYAQSYVRDHKKLQAKETDAFNTAGRLLQKPTTGLPGEDEARADLEQQLVNFGLLTQLDNDKLRSPELQSDIDAQLKEIARAASSVEQFTGLPSMGPSEPTAVEKAAAFTPGKAIKAVGGVKKKVAEADKPKSINELIAMAVGQSTGIGARQLQPAGLGTTINHIDASVKFEVGGITVEVPAGMAAAYSGAVKLGGDLGDAIRDALQPMLDGAFRAQRGQIIG